MRWDAGQPMLWKEDYGEFKVLAKTAEGFSAATELYSLFDSLGYLPDTIAGTPFPPLQGNSGYVVYTRGAAVYLGNLGDQKTITFAFPKFIDNEYLTTIGMKVWTNQPDWVIATGIELERDERTKVCLEWHTMELKPEAASISTSECGDGICTPGERPHEEYPCEEDCLGLGSCGDGVCDMQAEWAGPNACPVDCPDSPCGDGSCDWAEQDDPQLCPIDCK
jgi:hypothetical protein